VGQVRPVGSASRRLLFVRRGGGTWGRVPCPSRSEVWGEEFVPLFFCFVGYRQSFITLDFFCGSIVLGACHFPNYVELCRMNVLDKLEALCREISAGHFFSRF
jgi:hypothetical protein